MAPHVLIPDEYLIAEFFQGEADAIEELETQISGLQTEQAEAVEMAQEVAAYEPDEDKTVTAAAIKKVLKALIDDLKDSEGASAKRELDKLKAQDVAIKKIEKQIKVCKSSLKDKNIELEIKLQLKRLGGDGFKIESQQLIQQIEIQLPLLNPDNRTDKTRIRALNHDKAVLEERIANTDKVLAAIGGPLTDNETKHLILKKLYDIVNIELERYLNAEIRRLIAGIENLWNKYASSSQKMDEMRDKTLDKLNQLLTGLGYLK